MLAWFWTAVLGITLVGGAALQWLGPPRELARAPAQPATQQPAEPVKLPPIISGPVTLPPVAMSTAPVANLPVSPRPELADPAALGKPAGRLVDIAPLVVPAPAMQPAPLPQQLDPQPAAAPPDRAANDPATAGSMAPSPVAPSPVAPSPATPSPATADPLATGTADPAPARPRSQAIVTLHPAELADGPALAARLATDTGITRNQIDTGERSDERTRAVIRFYSVDDHALARRLGARLTQLGYTWRIDNLAVRPLPTGHPPLEVWLPKR